MKLEDVTYFGEYVCVCVLGLGFFNWAFLSLAWSCEIGNPYGVFIYLKRWNISDYRFDRVQTRQTLQTARGQTLRHRIHFTNAIHAVCEMPPPFEDTGSLYQTT